MLGPGMLGCGLSGFGPPVCCTQPPCQLASPWSGSDVARSPAAKTVAVSSRHAPITIFARLTRCTNATLGENRLLPTPDPAQDRQASDRRRADGNRVPPAVLARAASDPCAAM